MWGNMFERKDGRELNEEYNPYVNIPEFRTFEIRYTEWEVKMFHAAEEGPVKEAWRLAVLKKRREAKRIWREKLG